MNDKLMNMEQVTDRIGVAKARVLQMVALAKKGKSDFPKPITKPGADMLWKESDIEAFKNPKLDGSKKRYAVTFFYETSLGGETFEEFDPEGSVDLSQYGSFDHEADGHLDAVLIAFERYAAESFWEGFMNTRLFAAVAVYTKDGFIDFKKYVVEPRSMFFVSSGENIPNALAQMKGIVHRELPYE